MLRKQFYPDAALVAKLAEDAAAKGISESVLITDILNEYYGLKQNAVSLTALTATVLTEVANYIAGIGKHIPFDLNSASPTYRSIEMADFNLGTKTPKTVRASIGRSFMSQTGPNGQFNNVIKSTYKDKNGNIKQRLSQNNALMYEKI